MSQGMRKLMLMRTINKTYLAWNREVLRLEILKHSRRASMNLPIPASKLGHKLVKFVLV